MPTPIVLKITEKTINNQIKNMNAFESRDLDDDDEDDSVSCTISDLFELENIGGIGVRQSVRRGASGVWYNDSDNASRDSRHFQRFDFLVQK